MNDQKTPTMPDIGHSRFRRVERIATAMRKPLEGATVEPKPPRGVQFSKGTATWEEPQETRNVTHYNVYAPDENTLERRVPQGQVNATGIENTDRVFVSSYNSFTQLESSAVMGVDSEFDAPEDFEVTGNLQVDGDAHIDGSLRVDEAISCGSNIELDYGRAYCVNLTGSGGTLKYLSNGPAGYFVAATGIQVFTAPAGSAGSAAPLSERLTLKDDGSSEFSGPVIAKNNIDILGGSAIGHPVLSYKIDGSPRWQIAVNFSVGSFDINRLGVGGTFLDTPFQMNTFGAIQLGNGAGGILLKTNSISDANIPNGYVLIYVDEAANQLKFRVRYAGGTLKTGTVNLT